MTRPRVEELEQRYLPAATLLKDIAIGSSDPGNFVQVGGLVYFTAFDEDVGKELWVTDGTTEGTHLVKDIKNGVMGSDPMHLFAAGGRLFFTANDGQNGREL